MTTNIHTQTPVFTPSQTTNKRNYSKAGEYSSNSFFPLKTAKQLGYTISAKTLANLDAKELGLSQKLHIGGKVAYEKDNFLAC